MPPSRTRFCSSGGMGEIDGRRPAGRCLIESPAPAEVRDQAVLEQCKLDRSASEALLRCGGNQERVRQARRRLFESRAPRAATPSSAKCDQGCCGPDRAAEPGQRPGGRSRTVGWRGRCQRRLPSRRPRPRASRPPPVHRRGSGSGLDRTTFCGLRRGGAVRTVMSRRSHRRALAKASTSFAKPRAFRLPSRRRFSRAQVDSVMRSVASRGIERRHPGALHVEDDGTPSGSPFHAGDGR